MLDQATKVLFYSPGFLVPFILCILFSYAGNTAARVALWLVVILMPFVVLAWIKYGDWDSNCGNNCIDIGGYFIRQMAYNVAIIWLPSALAGCAAGLWRRHRAWKRDKPKKDIEHLAF